MHYGGLTLDRLPQRLAGCKPHYPHLTELNRLWHRNRPVVFAHQSVE
ncbi:Uncharacterised protein [Vibrio cholerae]|nr:Uncharacterised protein [Vibrio cholerae]